MEITLEYDLKDTNSIKVSAKIVTGFDPEQQGGNSLCGHWLSKTVKTNGNKVLVSFSVTVSSTTFVNPVIIMVSKIPGMTPTSKYAAVPQVPERYAIIIKPGNNHVSNDSILIKDGSIILFWVNYFDWYEIVGDNQARLEAVKYAAMLSNRAYPSNVRRQLVNPFYFAGVSLHEKGEIAFEKARDLPKSSAMNELAGNPPTVNLPPPHPDDLSLDAYEVGLLTKTENLPKLPEGFKWASVVSGIYFITTPRKKDAKSRMLFLDAVATKLLTDADPALGDFMKDQAKRLKGLAMAIDVIGDVIKSQTPIGSLEEEENDDDVPFYNLRPHLPQDLLDSFSASVMLSPGCNLEMIDKEFRKKKEKEEIVRMRSQASVTDFRTYAEEHGINF